MASLRVATFNMQHGRGRRGRVRLRRLAHACARLDVDLLALQEVDVGVARSKGADLAAVVGDATGLHVTFGPATALEDGEYGNALLTRTPPSDVQLLQLPSAREPRAALLARVGGISVAVTHLSVGADQHVGQLAVLLDALRARPAPRLLLGDLNHEQPDVPGFTLAVTPPTFPAHAPFLRLDHVAVDGLVVTHVHAVELPISDHRVLLATVG